MFYIKQARRVYNILQNISSLKRHLHKHDISDPKGLLASDGANQLSRFVAAAAHNGLILCQLFIIASVSYY